MGGVRSSSSAVRDQNSKKSTGRLNGGRRLDHGGLTCYRSLGLVAPRRPGVDRLIAGGALQVALQHRRQRALTAKPRLERGQHPALPHRAGLPGLDPSCDHPEQAISLRCGHAGVDQPIPGEWQQLRYKLGGGARAKPAAIAKRPGELGGQAVLGGPVQAVLGALERQRAGPAFVLLGEPEREPHEEGGIGQHVGHGGAGGQRAHLDAEVATKAGS
jgi:hypothetical protein